MAIRHSKIRTTKTGHIYQSGNTDAQTSWMVLHGYGQLALKLAGKFEGFAPDDVHVVAPEGLNRFYWKGVSDEPVASWMTSLDRQDEIADYVGFMDRVDQSTGWSKPGKKRILLGFSQGCATLWRWLINSKPDFDVLILWSGWLPEDMQYEKHLTYFNSKRIYYVYGDSDEYLTDDRANILRSRFKKEGFEIEYRPFNGTHRIPKEVLSEIVADILRR